jgi:hypothetical protein
MGAVVVGAGSLEHAGLVIVCYRRCELAVFASQQRKRLSLDSVFFSNVAVDKPRIPRLQIRRAEGIRIAIVDAAAVDRSLPIAVISASSISISSARQLAPVSIRIARREALWRRVCSARSAAAVSGVGSNACLSIERWMRLGAPATFEIEEARIETDGQQCNRNNDTDRDSSNCTAAKMSLL